MYASTALPPRVRTSTPILVASAWLVATIAVGAVPIVPRLLAICCAAASAAAGGGGHGHGALDACVEHATPSADAAKTHVSPAALAIDASGAVIRRPEPRVPRAHAHP